MRRKKNNLKILISGTKEAYEWQQETPANLWIGHKDSGNEIIYAGKNNLSEKSDALQICRMDIR